MTTTLYKVWSSQAPRSADHTFQSVIVSGGPPGPGRWGGDSWKSPLREMVPPRIRTKWVEKRRSTPSSIHSRRGRVPGLDQRHAGADLCFSAPPQLSPAQSRLSPRTPEASRNLAGGRTTAGSQIKAPPTPAGSRQPKHRPAGLTAEWDPRPEAGFSRRDAETQRRPAPAGRRVPPSGTRGARPSGGPSP